MNRELSTEAGNPPVTLVDSPELPGGYRGTAPGPTALGDVGGGAPQTPTFLTTIDLRKPGDVDLVNRAVVNGWDVSQPIRDQICDQFDGALDGALEGIREHRLARHVTRLLKLVRLMIKMEARNMIDDGHAKSSFPYLRKRTRDKRQRRCAVPVGERAARNGEALRRALAKLSALGESAERQRRATAEVADGPAS
jgi:hypothetical protein